MKKTILMLLLAALAAGGSALAGENKAKAEVLYFKANLACCKARACNTLESNVKAIIEKNWTDGSVTFRQIKLSDTVNNTLVEKYNARSQTLIIVVTKKKKESSADLSAILQDFATTNDAVKFEKELTDRINEVIK